MAKALCLRLFSVPFPETQKARNHTILIKHKGIYAELSHPIPLSSASKSDGGPLGDPAFRVFLVRLDSILSHVD